MRAWCIRSELNRGLLPTTISYSRLESLAKLLGVGNALSITEDEIKKLEADGYVACEVEIRELGK